MFKKDVLLLLIIHSCQCLPGAIIFGNVSLVLIDSPVIIIISVYTGPILIINEKIIDVCVAIKCFITMYVFLHLGVVALNIKIDYLSLSLCLSSNLSLFIQSLPQFFFFFLPLFPQLFCVCMLKLSLRRRCIVPACTFLISSDLSPGDLAALSIQSLNAAAFGADLSTAFHPLGTSGLLYESLLTCPQGQLGHLSI